MAVKALYEEGGGRYFLIGSLVSNQIAINAHFDTNLRCERSL